MVLMLAFGWVGCCCYWAFECGCDIVCGLVGGANGRVNGLLLGLAGVLGGLIPALGI
jgi:hypothetical protein